MTNDNLKPHGSRTDRFPIGPKAAKLAKAPKDKAKRTGQGERLQSSQRFFGETVRFEGQEYAYTRLTYWVKYANRHDRKALAAVLRDEMGGKLTEQWHENRLYLSLVGGCGRLSCVADNIIAADTVSPERDVDGEFSALDYDADKPAKPIDGCIAISLTAPNDVHEKLLHFSGTVRVIYNRATVPYGRNELARAKPVVIPSGNLPMPVVHEIRVKETVKGGENEAESVRVAIEERDHTLKESLVHCVLMALYGG